MSAFVGLLKPRSAFLWSDGAVYSHDNLLVAVERKCFPVTGVPMAVTARGPEHVAPLLVEHLQRWSVTPDDFLNDAVDIMSGWAFSISAYLADCPRPAFDVAVAGWSEAQERPFILFYDEKPGREPRCAFAEEEVAAPGYKPEEWPRIARECSWRGSFKDVDPQRWGKAVMSAIRRHPDDMPEGGERVCLVGGHILQTEISAAGVTDRILHTWPDVIGRPIDPKVRHEPPLMGGFGSRPKATL